MRRRAGLQTIPVLVQTSLNDVGSLEQALVENLHRENLNALEEAAAYQQLIDEFGMTHEEVAKRVGRSRAAVTNTLRLLQLPTGVQTGSGRGTRSVRATPRLLGDARSEFARVVGGQNRGRGTDGPRRRGGGAGFQLAGCGRSRGSRLRHPRFRTPGAPGSG